MTSITIEIDAAAANGAVAELQRRLADMSVVMKQIGDLMVGSTKARFATSTAPDGTPWAPNSMVTYLRMIESRAGTTLKRGKDAGRLSAKGIGLAVGKKPLIGRTKHLRDTIYPIVDPQSVRVGSPEIYAAVQQFGEAKGAAGQDSRHHLIPWGDIPPRPFIGMSVDDEESVLAIVQRYLSVGFGA